MSERDLADRHGFHLVASRRWAADTAKAERAADGGAVDGISCRLGDGSCAAAHAASISRSPSGRQSSIHRSLLLLQAQYGNRYVGRVLRQAGAAVDGASGDMDAIERSIEQARGGGQAMDHGTRTHMERAFGADFSGVLIHGDTRADGLSHSLSARAFTTGRDVFFRHGEYNPGSSSGRELLAHELTHVVQQNGDGIQRKMTVSEPGDAHEVEADRTARAVVEQEHAPAVDRQVMPPREQEEEERPLAMQRAADLLQRQPEAPTPQQEEEERKKRMLHAKRGTAVVSRREDRPAPK
jgi:hypothetical protein